jgi:hypothetical protein
VQYTESQKNDSANLYCCQARVVRRGRTFRKLLSMGLTWKITGRAWVPERRGLHGRTAQGNGWVIFYLGTTILCATTSAVLLVIGGVEKNPGPGVEAEKILQVVCSGCDRNLKSGTQCDTCGRWFHNICGNFKAQVAESGNGSVISVYRRVSDC